MSEVKRILDMIAAGQISSEEGMELIDAIKNVEEPIIEEVPAAKTVTPSGKKTYSFLKIKVLSDEDDTKVNVNIPLKLVKSLGGLTKNIGAYIPNDAKDTMSEHGVNLESLDIDAILEAIEEGAMEGPLIDVDTEENGIKTKVLIYVE